LDISHKHIVESSASVREVLEQLDSIASDAIVFVVDHDKVFIGSLTDGDIRRGLIKGLGLEHDITEFIQSNPLYIIKDELDFDQLLEWRANNYRLIPILDQQRKIIDIINFRLQRSYLPVDAVIMAGGRGERLRPLTDNTPKPLLKINGKPIIEYNIDLLRDYGVKNVTLSIRYLGQKLVDYFKDGSNRGLNIKYVSEQSPLGTIGALSLVNDFYSDYILIMNSDILTNIDFENLFKRLLDMKGDMIVATTPYEVTIPYGVIETDSDNIIALKEKPTYTYYSNAGIYIIKKSLLKYIPNESLYNATDLIELLIEEGKKVIQFPILGYWLDIGKPNDFEKAQRDIENIKF